MNVAAWLRELGLEQYVQTFLDNDVDAQTLKLLTESDLVAMGIASVGHRRKLAAAIDVLREVPAEPARTAVQTFEGAAERRQLSVLCCDMVGSTALSQQLDPEQYREVLRLFHQRCVRAVAEYDGWVANFIGDCVLAYFGWPHAHEDDAERAVRTALAIVQAVAADGVAVRGGIATGAVVVGDLIREGPAREHSAVGATPDLAAHLQTLAAPGQVVVDDLTRRLTPDFAVQPLPPQAADGLEGNAYRVSGERNTDSRFDARKGYELTPMVGRDQELALLLERWARAQAGEGLAVLLVGEAGIGKSRLTRAVLDACAGQAHRVRWQCSPYHTGSAMWPVIQQLGRSAGLQADDSTDVALDKVEALTEQSEEAAALYATMLGLNGAQRYGPLQMTPQMLRERTLEVLVEQLFEMAEERPLLLVVEDAHWIDPTTVEVIERCLGGIDQSRMLILITSRSGNQPALAAHPSVTRLSLNRLGRASVETIASGLAGGRLKPETLATIVAQTDGVPLFVEELTKAMIETGEAAIPASLHGSLMARLDRLEDVREAAQVAACIGREFDLSLLQAVSDKPETVAPAIAKLIAAELVFQRGDRARPRFTFKHALVQEAARESLLQKKREGLHARILRVLEAERPDTPRELLAHHATCANLPDRALVHWTEAGKGAQAKSAYVEAISFLERAIDLIRNQADDATHRSLELDLQMRLGQCRMGFDGLSSEPARQAFHRANELLKIGPPNRPCRLAVQYGLFNWYYSHGQLRNALELGLEALSAEEVDGTPESLRMAQRMVATTYAYLGDLRRAEPLYEQVMPAVDSDRYQEASTQFLADQRIAAFYQYSLMLCLQGHAERSRQVMAKAQSLCTPMTPALQRGYMHLLAAVRAGLVHDYAGVETAHSALFELATQHRMLRWFEGLTDLLTRWAAMESGQPGDKDIASYLHAIEHLEASGQRLFVPFFMSRLAKGLSARGRHAEALQMIERASVACEETAQGWCEAELWRVRGELLQHVPHRLPEAGDCFTKALSVARARGTKLWEVPAAMSLAHLRG